MAGAGAPIRGSNAVVPFTGYGGQTFNTIFYGTFPQTAITNAAVHGTLLADLNYAFNGGALRSGMTASGHFTTNTIASNNVFPAAFDPTNHPAFMFRGDRYVRVPVRRQSTNLRYMDGELVPETGTDGARNYIWHRVEPVQWIVMRQVGNTKELLSLDQLMGGIAFFQDSTSAGRTEWRNSQIRSYLNDPINGMFAQMFSSAERGRILNEYITNNNPASPGGWQVNSVDNDFRTRDRLFLPSSYDLFGASSIFNPNNNTGVEPWRLSGVSDFALSNNAWHGTGTDGLSRPENGGWWWLRSADNVSVVRGVTGTGLDGNYAPHDVGSGVRPALRLSIT